MKKSLFLILLFLLSGFMMAQESGSVNQNRQGYHFFAGTYTRGQSEGIYVVSLSPEGKLSQARLVAKTENPSFLALSPDKKFLLAVNENNPGTVESYAVQPDTLQRLSRRRSGGDAPCFVSVNRQGEVLTANYGSGTVGLLKMDKNGKLSPLLFTENHHAEGMTAHAHEARFLPGTRQMVSVDLGTNRLWFSHLDAGGKKLVPDKQRTLDLPPGSGPRHFVLHPNGKWMYVVNELGNSVSLVHRTTEGQWVLKKTVSALPAGFRGKSYCAEIRITQDGRFLYVSNRGHNSLALFRVTPSGDDLKRVANIPVHGDFPRFFVLTPDENYLLVANQKSDNIVVFKRNKKTGLLQYTDEMKMSSPVCVVFFALKQEIAGL